MLPRPRRRIGRSVTRAPANRSDFQRASHHSTRAVPSGRTRSSARSSADSSRASKSFDRAPRSGSQRPKRRFPWWIFPVAGLMWGSSRQIQAHFSQPQAILVLGGSPDREHFAAGLAQDYPDLPIWVSSGSNQEYSEWVFEQAKIDRDRVHLDYRAVDTLTNFTTLVDDLQRQGITSIYLVTSDYHMRRAQWIGEVVGASRGIVFKSVPIPTDQPEESLSKSFRDSARAVVWTLTGYTGAREEEGGSEKEEVRRKN